MKLNSKKAPLLLLLLFVLRKCLKGLEVDLLRYATAALDTPETQEYDRQKVQDLI
jgi:hypothetical protein